MTNITPQQDARCPICCQIFKGILCQVASVINNLEASHISLVKSSKVFCGRKNRLCCDAGIPAIVIEILSQIDFISSYMGLVIFVSTFLQIREQDVRMQGIQAMLKEMSHQIEFQQSNQNIHLIVLSNIKKHRKNCECCPVSQLIVR